MRANVLEIPIIKSESQRKLGLDLSIREAVRDHLQHRWRSGTAKCAAVEYDLTLDRAREACAGRASLTTVERIIKVGGWPVLLALGARILGRSVTDYLIELRENHNENADRLGAVLGGWRPMAADRSFDRPHADRGADRRRGADADRAAQKQG